MPLSLKSNLSQLQPCPHGGIDYLESKEKDIAQGTIIDFSVNINPFGPPPKVKQALTEIVINYYPDSEARELKQALADKLGVTPGNILVANGSTELLRLLALSYLNPKDLVIIPQPTFGEYEIACHLIGSRLLKPWGDKKENFTINTAHIQNLIKKHRPKAIFLSNPNNPTGQYFSREEIEGILYLTKDSLMIVDEAYINFVDERWSSVDLIRKGNLVILRSMTKDYALAGIRLGYAIAQESIISDLRRVQPPWNTNVVAQKLGLIALQADEYLAECQARLREAKNYLVTELTALGLRPLPSKANFFLIEVGDAKKFKQILLRKGILVRDCTSFGLPNYIRLSVQTLSNCEKLIKAIREIKSLLWP